mgnify:FL=1
METVMAFLVGGLFAVGVYLLLRRSIVRILIGIAILSNATNLLVFTAAGLVRGGGPLVPEGATAVPPPYADPLPQALILTAIVIGFGVLAFAVVLAYRVYQTLGTDNLDDLRSTEE